MLEDELVEVPNVRHCEVCGEILETRKERTKGLCLEHINLYDPSWYPTPLNFNEQTDTPRDGNDALDPDDV